jgi:hypothetical protein
MPKLTKSHVEFYKGEIKDFTFENETATYRYEYQPTEDVLDIFSMDGEEITGKLYIKLQEYIEENIDSVLATDDCTVA